MIVSVSVCTGVEEGCVRWIKKSAKVTMMSPSIGDGLGTGTVGKLIFVQPFSIKATEGYGKPMG